MEVVWTIYYMSQLSKNVLASCRVSIFQILFCDKKLSTLSHLGREVDSAPIGDFP